MDFDRELMQTRGYGEYEQLDSALLPNIYMAYRTSLSEGTEVFHNSVRERWQHGDSEIVSAMRTWASYAEQGRDALLEGNSAALNRLIDKNFDLRAEIYSISKGNLEMIEIARSVGASANFAGSGGAIVGCYRDDDMFHELQSAMKTIGVAVIKPKVTNTRAQVGTTAASY